MGIEDEVECDSSSVVKLYYRDQPNDRKHINFVVLCPTSKIRNSSVYPSKSPRLVNCAFEIVEDAENGAGRTYYLLADDEDTKLKWMSGLSFVCQIIIRVLFFLSQCCQMCAKC